MPISTVCVKIRSTMLCLSGFELYSRWMPLMLKHSTFLHAQREGRVVILRPHRLHRLSFDTTQFITTSLTSQFAGISDYSLS